MIRKHFANDLYLKISRNVFEVKNVSVDPAWHRIEAANNPFTTERLLVGTFSAAKQALDQVFDKAVPKNFIRLSPAVVIHPTEMIDGGLSEVESQVLRELVLGAGAFKVVIHTGDELMNHEVQSLLSQKPKNKGR